MALLIVAACITCAWLKIPEEFDIDAWIVIGTIGLMFVSLLFDILAAHFAMTLALAVLMFSQVVDTQEGLEGFSSSAVLSVAVLYVVAAGLTATGALNYFMNKVLGTPGSLAGAQLRLMLPVVVISAFMNNTPVVAIMIPIVQQWAPKAKIPVSQLFVPLSFASILGGSCTLIGTSTNLVVAGKAETDANFVIGLFDLATVAVPTLITGLIYIILFSPCLLPDEKILTKRLEKVNGVDNPLYNELISASPTSLNLGDPTSIYRSVTVSCLVNSSSTVVNKTITAAGLRGLSGLFLTSVQRGAEFLQAIGPEFVINENDILFFTGIVDNFPEFCLVHDFTPVTSENEDKIERIRARGDPSFTEESSLINVPSRIDSSIAFENALKKGRNRSTTLESHLIRVIVREGGDLAGQSPKNVNFRRTYKAAILSVHRRGTKFSAHGNLGRTTLQANDQLFVLTAEEFSWADHATRRDLKLIPDVKKPESNSLEREFIFSMKVSESTGIMGVTPLVGKSIENAGLRGLPGLFLIALEREELGIKRAVGSDEILEKDDILWFVGERNSFAVLRQIPGLVSPSGQEKKLNYHKVDRRLVECVISMNSDMIGKTISQAKFRSRFRAAVIAVHREGQRVLRKIGDIQIRPGDVLILDTGPYFLQRFRDDRNFLLVAEIENSGVPQFGKFYLALFAVIGMMALFTIMQSFDDVSVSLFECAVLAAGVMIFFNILSPDRVMDSISWEVVVAIATAFGISTALENSGVAEAVGNTLVDLADATGTGDVGLFTSVYLATFLVSIVVANNAAALLMFPIAIQAISTVDETVNRALVDEEKLKKMLYILMLAASSSFSSPFGYQTNLMVYGPGSYRFTDFLKFGLPMQFWQMVFSVAFVVGLDRWYLSWVASIGGFIVIVSLKFFLAGEGCFCRKSKSSAHGEMSESTGVNSDNFKIDGGLEHHTLKHTMEELQLPAEAQQTALAQA